MTVSYISACVCVCALAFLFVHSLEAPYQSGLSEWAVNKQLAQTVGLAVVACLNCQTPKNRPWARLSQQPLRKNLNIRAIHPSYVAIALSYIQWRETGIMHLGKCGYIFKRKSYIPS